MNQYQQALYAITSYILKTSSSIPKKPHRPTIRQVGDYVSEITFRELKCATHPGYEYEHEMDLYYKEMEIQNELNFILSTLPRNYQHPSLSATVWIDDEGYGTITVQLER